MCSTTVRCLTSVWKIAECSGSAYSNCLYQHPKISYYKPNEINDHTLVFLHLLITNKLMTRTEQLNWTVCKLLHLKHLSKCAYAHGYKRFYKCPRLEEYWENFNKFWFSYTCIRMCPKNHVKKQWTQVTTCFS